MKIIKKSYHRIQVPENRRIHHLRYILHPELILEASSLQAEFDTSTTMAKQWFFPRYLDGSLHEPGVTQKLLEVLEPTTTFFDIGSNLGYFSTFASLACTAGEIHAFEMDQYLAELASENIRKNTETDYQVVCAAVSSDSGELVSYAPHISGNPSTFSLTESGSSGSNSARLSTLTLALDDYCSRTTTYPEVMKIDVEGHEMQVLRGGEEILREHVEHLFIEIHGEIFDDSDNKIKTILDRLTEFGFDLHVFDDHRRGVGVTPLEEADDRGKNFMLYCKQ